MAQERNIDASARIALRNRWPQMQYLKIEITHYPDRLVLLGDGRHIWIELKTKKGAIRPGQVIQAEHLRFMGETVHVCRSTGEVIAAIEEAVRLLP